MGNMDRDKSLRTGIQMRKKAEGRPSLGGGQASGGKGISSDTTTEQG